MTKRKEIARSGLILANVGIALAGLGYFVAIVLGLAAFVTFLGIYADPLEYISSPTFVVFVALYMIYDFLAKEMLDRNANIWQRLKHRTIRSFAEFPILGIEATDELTKEFDGMTRENSFIFGLIFSVVGIVSTIKIYYELFNGIGLDNILDIFLLGISLCVVIGTSLFTLGGLLLFFSLLATE